MEIATGAAAQRGARRHRRGWLMRLGQNLARRSWQKAPVNLARLLLRPFPDRLYLALGHFAYFGRWPDYDNPRTFNEHIQAYMLNCRDPLLRIPADKIATREYIRQHYGEELLVPLIGVWDNADQVPVESLPRPCVLKPTAASGLVMMLRENDPRPAEEIRATMDRWLRRDYSRLHREWCYEGLPRRLMAEVMLRDPNGTVPPDYKAYVIGGKVRFIQVDRGRFAHHTRNIYGPDWRPLPARWTLQNHPPDPRPPMLEKMVEVAETLGEPFEFLRVDYYVLGDHIYIGELTNYPGAGFEKFIPASYALHIGSFWTEVRQRALPTSASSQRNGR